MYSGWPTSSPLISASLGLFGDEAAAGEKSLLGGEWPLQFVRVGCAPPFDELTCVA